MKEYYSELGGRHLYSSDIKNLQELALAFAQLFKGANVNFVLSGCKATGSNEHSNVRDYTEGYVYLDGRICHVDAAENVSGNNLKIVLKQRNGGNIPYADGTYHPQYVEYYGEYVNDTITDTPYIAAYSYNAQMYFPDLKLFLKKWVILQSLEGVDDSGYSPTQDIYTSLSVHNILSGTSLESEQNVSLYRGKYQINVDDNSVSFIWSDGFSLKIGNDSSNTLYYRLKDDVEWKEFGAIYPTNGIMPHLQNLDVDELYVKNLKINGGNVPGTIPLGGIIPYAGRLDMIPSDYVLCDGSKIDCLSQNIGGGYSENEILSPIFDVMNGVSRQEISIDTTTNKEVTIWKEKYFYVPDLRGRFIAGYDKNAADYSKIGNTGGEKTHILSIKEIPQHKHTYQQNDLKLVREVNGNSPQVEFSTGASASPGFDLGGMFIGRKGADAPSDLLVGAQTYASYTVPNTKTAFTDETGAGQPHENRPPYYVLAYIMRII